MQMAGENPFPGTVLSMFILQVHVDMFEPVTANEEIAFRWIHGPPPLGEE